MLFELTDFDNLLEYKFKHCQLTIYKLWTRSYSNSNHIIPLYLVCHPNDGYSFKLDNHFAFTSCQYFMMNSCPMIIFQSLPIGITRGMAFLLVPQFSTFTGELTWTRVGLPDPWTYYKYLYMLDGKIILKDATMGHVEIAINFSDITYKYNNVIYNTTCPSVASKICSNVKLEIDQEPIILNTEPIDVYRADIPPDIYSDNAYCYKHGEYYIYGDRSRHILVKWDTKYVKHMKPEIRLCLCCIFLCIKRKKLYTKVAKVLWLKYILPIIVFHIPKSHKASVCIIS